MEFEQTDSTLNRMAADAKYNGPYAVNVARAFRKVLNLIASVQNESELYQFKSLHFEKLKGNRDHQRSLRLDDQWRLIVEIAVGETGNVVVIRGIEDYH